MTAPRTGVYAGIDGREHLAEAPPAAGVVVLTDGRQVPVAACEWVAEVTTRADFRGHPCQVVAVTPGGSVGLYHLGEDKSAAAEDGFVQIDPGTWACNADIHALTRWREHHAFF